jgi:signal transduction histidine kinase/FixJ family two-component response regulator
MHNENLILSKVSQLMDDIFSKTSDLDKNYKFKCLLFYHVFWTIHIVTICITESEACPLHIVVAFSAAIIRTVLILAQKERELTIWTNITWITLLSMLLFNSNNFRVCVRFTLASYYVSCTHLNMPQLIPILNVVVVLMIRSKLLNKIFGINLISANTTTIDADIYFLDIMLNYITGAVFSGLLKIKDQQYFHRANSNGASSISDVSRARTENDVKNEEIIASLQKTVKILELSKQELEDTLRTKDVLLASVSHELKNPLNSILTNIELAQIGNTDTRHQDLLHTAKVCVDILVNQINNFIDVAKSSSNQLEIQYNGIDLYDVIEREWIISDIKLKERGLNGVLYISKHLPKYVIMDSQRLAQIFYNLVNSTAKSGTNGSVKVYLDWLHQAGSYGNVSDRIITEEASSDTDEFALRQSPHKKYALYEQSRKLGSNEHIVHGFYVFEKKNNINDNLTQMFQENEPFFRTQMKSGIIKVEIVECSIIPAQTSKKSRFHPSSNTTDSKLTDSTQITDNVGLYISKQLITTMKGTLEVNNSKEEGSKITFQLPCDRATNMNCSPKTGDNLVPHSIPRAIKDAAISTKMIGVHLNKALVVDDDQLNQTVMRHHLQRLGLEVVVASNGQEAYNHYIHSGFKHFSFITMDINMPIMDGISSAVLIRQWEKSQGYLNEAIPIIFISANSLEEEREMIVSRSGDIKAFGYYKKPLKFTDCKHFVKQLVHEKLTKQQRQVSTNADE